MIYTSTFIACFFLGCIAYRIRGGGWFTFNSDTVCRLIWGFFGLFIPFCALQIVSGNFPTLPNIIFANALMLLAFGAMMIPHAFAQNMGTFGRPWTLGPNNIEEPWTKYWPGIWIPFFPVNQDEWDVCPGFFKTLFDFLGMLVSGTFSGLMVFGLPLAAALILPHYGIDSGFDPRKLCIAIARVGVGQALGYLLGRFMPKAGPSLQPGATWGEFWNGGVWVYALSELS